MTFSGRPPSSRVSLRRHDIQRTSVSPTLTRYSAVVASASPRRRFEMSSAPRSSSGTSRMKASASSISSAPVRKRLNCGDVAKRSFPTE